MKSCDPSRRHGRKLCVPGRNPSQQRAHRRGDNRRQHRRVPLLSAGGPGPSEEVPLQVHGVLRQDDPVGLADSLHERPLDSGSGLHRPRPPDSLCGTGHSSVIRSSGWSTRVAGSRQLSTKISGSVPGSRVRARAAGNFYCAVDGQARARANAHSESRRSLLLYTFFPVSRRHSSPCPFSQSGVTSGVAQRR